MTLIFFIKILLAHLVGDFLLQPGRWVAHKSLHKIRSKYLYFHILIHIVLLVLVLGFQFTYWAGILIIITSHFIIDVLKIYLQTERNRRSIFFADQLLHILILVIVTAIYFPFAFSDIPFAPNPLFLTATSLILVTVVAAVVMQVIISRWDSEEEQREIKSKGLEKAGYYIGILERLFVFGFIVLQHWEGVGFLLAAKSIFRFGDLSKAKDRKLTEYVLIGTLLSFGFAIVIALGFLAVKQFIG